MPFPFRRKYRNKPVISEDGRFDSKKEFAIWQLRKIAADSGTIFDLRRQVPYKLVVNGLLICTYRADFVYRLKGESTDTVEDVKGFRTPEYKLKKKLMAAIWGIEILET